jgi:hypothetical protein
MREPDPLLRRLERDAAIWCALATAGALALRPDQPGIAGGVAGGGLLAMASLLAIRSSVDAILARIVPAAAPASEPAPGDEPGPGREPAPARAGAGLAVKLAGRYALLGLGAYVMIVRLRLHAIGVLIGASSLVAGASIEAVRSLRRP